MLRKIKRLKPANLIAGLKATGICPLNSNEVLKRLPDDIQITVSMNKKNDKKKRKKNKNMKSKDLDEESQDDDDDWI